MHLATIGDHEECVKFLIDKGATIKIKNKENWKASDLVVQNLGIKKIYQENKNINEL